MTVATRLRAALAIHVAAIVALAMFYARTVHRAADSGRALSEIAGRVRVETTEQLSLVDEMSRAAEKYLVTRDSGYRREFVDASQAYGRELKRLASTPVSEPERVSISLVASDWQRFEAYAPRLAGSAKVGRATIDTLQAMLDGIREGTEQLGAASQVAMHRQLAASGAAAREAARLAWLAAGGALMLGIILSVVLVRSILRPLGLLAEGTRAVSDGRFDHRLKTGNGDEFSRVANDFNSMVERLAELDRMKKDFVARVSHDLKTPLSSMQETIGALLDELAGPLSGKQRQLLEMNLESGRRLSGMLGKLLDLSRVEAGVSPVADLVDVHQIARRSVDGARLSAAHRGVKLSVVGSGQPTLVRGDSGGIAQVFDNLMENAIKFSPDDGAVVVSIEQPTPGEVTVAVTDEGPGVPASERDRVFERFYQTDAGRAARGRGVGLGLTICREIVSAHGGRIWVDENKPRGSVFHVVLRASAAVLAGIMVIGSAACATVRRSPEVARPEDLEARITALTIELAHVRASLDSTAAAADSLRLELQRLKDIDLKPRTPARRPPSVR